MTQDPRAQLTTHDVENQPGPPSAADLWATDRALREAAGQAGARTAPLARAGATFGSAELREAGEAARHHPPELRLFDRAGRRLDEVAFHPGYHKVLGAGLASGYANLAWDSAPGGHATHAAMVYMLTQVEPGICCPLTMTYAAVPALAADPALSAIWTPKLLSAEYDARIAPVEAKFGATMGMAMTEKQGGSDVRANTTRATPDGDAYRLTGHKWFCSAPMSDAFLTLAQTEQGLTCFLVPRWTEEGRNAIQIQRLKDKLGNRANASSEIEYHGALAHRLGDEGRGVATIIEMVHHTRLDTAMAPAGLMRAALVEVKHWIEGRRAFQKRLVDQPLMRAVVADLVLEWEASLALGMRAAKAFDDPSDAGRAFARISVALAKFWSNKRCGPVILEAMECLGGMGYVEETPMPMLYREAPLNSIWEGSGNVIALDILRTLAREPLAGETLRAELQAAKGADRRYDTALAAHLARWPGLPDEGEARWFAERLAILLAASVLLRTGNAALSDGWMATRVAGEWGVVPGSVTGLDTEALIARI